MSLLGGAVVLATLVSSGDSVLHPLDPLSAGEIGLVRQVLAATGKLGRELRFASITLSEPPKDAVLRQLASGRFSRSAQAIAFDWATSTPYRGEVDLTNRRLIAWDTLPSREPPSRNLIRRRIEEIARPDPRWQQALRRRGIFDPARVTIIPNLGESQPLPWRNGERVVGASGYAQEGMGPAVLPGIRLVVNLSRGSIIQLDDGSTGNPPDPPDNQPGSPAALVRPTEGSPPRDSIQLRGSEIRWKNWTLHFGVHPRRGLELWDISWSDGGRPRRILYRAGVAEAMAAYGDPGFTEWYPRDAGNGGLGDYQDESAVELADAPAGARFADAVFADDSGRPVVMPRAVAIYERDGGLLWRHARTARRGRQLVVSSHSTIDDYDFVFSWSFSEDGAIEVAVELTGVMLLHRELPAGRESDSHRSFGHLVAPGWVAPNHQHFFSFRLDFDIDGATPNRVLELETVRVPQGRRNPRGLWFAMEERPLASEQQAQRNLHTAAARKWRVINPAVKNALGESVGYVLQPGEVAIPYAAARSPARRAAGFVGFQLWATPLHRDEMYAAGEFVNFGLLDQGLPSWTRSNRPLLDTDIVLWYTLGVTHLPRPEEYPVMPVHRAAFRLLPSGFFARNPGFEPSR
jgi:primary-amine oxidase